VTPFYWSARVYWEDTDGGGIVYYANYLRFLERARTEWMRSHGIWQRQTHQELGVVFVIVSINVEYRQPARLDDLLSISCVAAPDGGASLLFQQKIRRDSPDGELLLEATVRAACLDASKMKPRRIPPAILKLMP
jgi:acyl-CoA thioester hydrolase